MSEDQSMMSTTATTATVALALEPKAVLALAVVAVAVLALHAAVAVLLPVASAVTVPSAVDVAALTLGLQHWADFDWLQFYDKGSQGIHSCVTNYLAVVAVAVGAFHNTCSSSSFASSSITTVSSSVPGCHGFGVSVHDLVEIC